MYYYMPNLNGTIYIGQGFGYILNIRILFLDILHSILSYFTKMQVS